MIMSSTTPITTKSKDYYGTIRSGFNKGRLKINTGIRKFIQEPQGQR